MNRTTTHQAQDKDAFKMMVELSVDGMLVIDADGVVQYANPTAISMFFDKTDDLIGFHFGFPAIHEPVDLMISTGDNLLHVEMRASDIQWEGRPASLASLRDITKRKEAENALRESEERFRLAFDNASIGKTLIHLDGGFKRVNHALCKMIGYTQEELLQCTIFDITHPDDIDLSRTCFDNSLTDDKDAYHLEKRYLHKNEQVVWVSVSSYLLRDAQGVPLYHVGDIIDITERKQAEEALRESESKLRQFFNAMLDVILVLDVNGCYVDIVPTSTNLLYKPPDQLLGRTLHEIFPADQADSYMSIIHGVLNSKRMHSFDYSVEIDGNKIWFSANVAPFASDSVIWVARDITDRYKAEEALRKQRLLLQEMERIAKIGGWEFDANTEELTWTEEVARIHECDPQEEINLRQAMNLYQGESYNIVETVVAEAIELGKSFDIELELVPASGVHKYVRSIGHPVIQNGKVVKVHGALQDITDRKLADEQLSQSEERFRLAFDNARIGKIIIDLDGSYIRVNQAFCDMLGYTQEELLRSNVFDISHPDDVEMSRHNITMMLTEGIDAFYTDKRYVHKDGHAVWVALCNYLMRDQQGNPLYFIGDIIDITERKLAEEKMRKLSQAMEQSPASVMITDTGGVIEYVNPQFTKVSGYTLDELVGKKPNILKSGETPLETYKDLWETIISGREWRGELLNTRKDGTKIWESIIISPILDDSGAITHFLEAKEDITEHKSLQSQLIHSQKMESIGRLAGGIAHDFNNLLTAINGYAQLMLFKLPNDSPMVKDLNQIYKAGERAAALTQQLLAFSRKQVMRPKTLDLNQLILGMDDMLSRLIGEDVLLNVFPRENLYPIKADPGQIEQVLMNLVLNARDAMPKGGAITIETQNVQLDDSYVMTHMDSSAGDFVMLTISDTGQGISKENFKHLFEPFFTTKEKGKGTGLGLSTVYGIVKQSGGSIYVYSEPGEGATFKLYFPRDLSTKKPDAPQIQETTMFRGHETILLVEDEELVRNLIARTLNVNGYLVIEASDGTDALEIYNDFTEKVHMLVTDVIMPRMSGRDLAEHLTGIQPDLKVLYVSGYTDNAIVHHGILDEGIAFLQKPFSHESLLRKVRETLDG